jgi:hypothetical protein
MASAVLAKSAGGHWRSLFLLSAGFRRSSG